MTEETFVVASGLSSRFFALGEPLNYKIIKIPLPDIGAFINTILVGLPKLGEVSSVGGSGFPQS